MKKWLMDGLYLVVIVVLFVTLVFGFRFITSESKECVEQPFIYGASKIAGDTFCSCYSTTETETLQFKFNDTHFEMTRTDWGKPFE